MDTDDRKYYSYLSPKLEGKSHPEKGGHGVFAREAVQKGEVLTVWGGVVVPERRLEEFPEYAQTHGIQVEEDHYLLPLTTTDPADYFNHSCDPNTGMSGQICLVAIKDIAPGDEVCFDYAMSDSNPYDEFDCRCGAPNCRGRVTADDWTLPELQRRYQGYFSPYLQRRIDANK